MDGSRIELYYKKDRYAVKKRKEKRKQKHLPAHKGGLPPKASGGDRAIDSGGEEEKEEN